MTSFLPLTEAQARLPAVLDQMIPGQKLFVTGADGQIVATIIKEPPPRTTPRPVPGRCRGMLTILAEDDEHLADFADYMT